MEVGMLQDHKYRDFEFTPGANNQCHEQLWQNLISPKYQFRVNNNRKNTNSLTVFHNTEGRKMFAHIVTHIRSQVPPGSVIVPTGKSAT